MHFLRSRRTYIYVYTIRNVTWPKFTNPVWKHVAHDKKAALHRLNLSQHYFVSYYWTFCSDFEIAMCFTFPFKFANLLSQLSWWPELAKKCSLYLSCGSYLKASCIAAHWAPTRRNHSEYVEFIWGVYLRFIRLNPSSLPVATNESGVSTLALYFSFYILLRNGLCKFSCK